MSILPAYMGQFLERPVRKKFIDLLEGKFLGWQIIGGGPTTPWQFWQFC